MTKAENKDTFYVSTKASFKGCKRPKRKPDYISLGRDGRVSSEYWYSEKGVIRCSNHWSAIDAPQDLLAFECGKVASCYWVLKNPSPNKGYSDIPCGFCPWDRFKYI